MQSNLYAIVCLPSKYACVLFAAKDCILVYSERSVADLGKKHSLPSDAQIPTDYPDYRVAYVPDQSMSLVAQL
jgi:hypothetical protein